MPQKIESDKVIVKDIFQKWYRVPEYQRPYVWESDQVIELLDDIYKARNANKESEYFLGSMVLKKNRKSDGKSTYDEFDLLDGQQRLTTLFLITAVIRDMTPKNNETRLNTCRESIFQIANPDDNVPERMRIIFDIRDNVKDFVNQYIKNDGGTLLEDEFKDKFNNENEDISIRNMSNAILVIRDYFLNGKDINEFFPYLRSNVLMIYVSAEELDDAFHLFTVMNNRGMKLRNSDILKAENLKEVKNDTKRIDFAKKWESIEDYFGEDFDNFLSHLRTLLVKQKASTSLLKEFEDNIYAPKEFDRIKKIYKPKPPLLQKGEKTFEFIDRYYKHYLDLFDIDHSSIINSIEFANCIAVMTNGFEADYWIAPLLRFYEKFKKNRLVDFVKKLDNKFSSDWIAGLSPTTRIENINSIIDYIDKSHTPGEVIDADIFKINERDLKRILFGEIYGKHYAKYLLLKLDLLYQGNTTNYIPPPTITIEHILPQNPNSKSTWVKNFTSSERTTWTNRLGNLVLISRRKNSSQGNLDYVDKKTKYFKNNVELFSNSIRIYNQYSTWEMKDLMANHKNVVKKIVDSYAISISKKEWDDYLK